jgi:hypothetical protein
MDLNQQKLTKSEWETIEMPVSQDEIEVLKLIIKGNNDVNVRYNKTDSIFTFLKIEYGEKMEDFIFNKYFREKITEFISKYKASYLKLNVNSNPVLKKADLIRITKNTETTIDKSNIYEYVLLEQIEKILKYQSKNSKKMEYYYFTLYKLLKNTVPLINRHILEIANKIIHNLEDVISIQKIIENSVECIEKNPNLIKYGDMMLYEHQKEIITSCKKSTPKLILYIAPTGTGKTITPIGLSEQNKIIFVCAARHVGLALARSAISVNKRVAFAFGCDSADDIRLHYFSAKEFSKNKRTGGIWKVDNSIGDKVEIMICDIKSYLPAMYYMLSFNKSENLIVYWDEPTITLDYAEHEFHAIIKKNWSENLIENMVLSSATLPKLHELTDTTNDFKSKFPNADIISIVSNDCKKSIPIINNNGYVVLPHYLSQDYDEILKIVNHCENYLTLLRYFDLKEVIRFIMLVQNNNYTQLRFKIERSFGSLDDIDMKNIKLYYLNLLKNIIPGLWGSIYLTLKNSREKRILPNNTINSKGNKITKINSLGPGTTCGNFEGVPLLRLASEPNIPTKPINTEVTETPDNCAIYLTTKDAYTLTDGPTIFLSNNVEKISNFCVQQANIPIQIMNDILKKIEFNNSINDKILKLEKDLEDISNKDVTNKDTDKGGKTTAKNDHKCNRDPSSSKTQTESLKISSQLETLRSMIKTATLNECFVPNKLNHIQKWAGELNPQNAFSSNISEDLINKIMLLQGVNDSWKVLLLMGIGVFTNHENINYTEIMKKLADEQKLYLIIASSDYIYGTNYQFCHGYLSKDLELTQEKIIQAMGRVGRNKYQQDYTVRFRDDSQIMKLFTSDTDKPEIINMNRLFNSC